MFLALANEENHRSSVLAAFIAVPSGTYQESCPLGVLELSTFLKLTSI
jgi:hypothetical protein